MAQAMKRLGIQQVEIPATEVIIKTPDKDIIILDPQVSKVNMMGQDTIQVVGRIVEREHSSEAVEISEDDVKTVMDQAGVSEEEAKEAITKHKGDLAAAIMSLQK